jgi:hypothetical protein
LAAFFIVCGSGAETGKRLVATHSQLAKRTQCAPRDRHVLTSKLM